MPGIDKSFSIIKAMDVLSSHLGDRMGIRKVPLSYVIRTSQLPVALENLHPHKATGESYDTIVEELIQCVPLLGEHFNEDNAKMFQILQEIVNGTTFESSIKAYQKKRDGRSAYLALCQYNLGSAK